MPKCNATQACFKPYWATIGNKTEFINYRLAMVYNTPSFQFDKYAHLSFLGTNINLSINCCSNFYRTFFFIKKFEVQNPVRLVARSRHRVAPSLAMEEQFILRVPPSVAERIERLLNDPTSSSDDKSLDLSFSDDGRTGSFVIGNDRFSASLLDLPTVVESYKTYDDSALIKTADIGQMITVTEEGDGIPDIVEYRHGLTAPMRDARRRRFRREPDLNPEVVRRVEKDLQNIMAGGTAENISVAMADQEEDGEENARLSKKARPTPSAKPDVPEAATVGGEPDGSDTDESDDSI